MIQESRNESAQNVVIEFLKNLVPQGIWQHDKQDNKGDSHLKTGLVGPSETISIIDGKIGLSTWQNIFFVNLMGPGINEPW